jgi:hypothetical protein
LWGAYINLHTEAIPLKTPSSPPHPPVIPTQAGTPLNFQNEKLAMDVVHQYLF